MFEMLVQRSNPVTPLTPVSTPPGTHNSDLSPRSSNSSSFGSPDGLHTASLHSPNNGRSSQEFSALQKLQFALSENGLFSSVLQGKDEDDRRLIKPCQSSSSSNFSNSPDEANDGEMHSSPSPNEIKVHIPDMSPNNSINIFECPLCTIICSSRHDFNEHLVTHSQQFACPKCSFFTDHEMKLKDHITEAHDGADLDNFTDEEAQTPKTNSQGKVKTFKCKQCGYQAVTKKDFWDHTKGHIRQEKMLTCPKCPFVTEYKHHLEYHLRNHFGSKPFQCNKCAYSCVNKSMLNSHLKSHSNIYQYRCADCAYATKYCHSLKLHLRKYGHKPSMVLNPDGTPNPLPIIDVYGTRRGPKIKRTDADSVDMGSTCLSPVTPKEKAKTQKTPRRQKPSNVSSANLCGTPPSSSSPIHITEITQEYNFSPNLRMSPDQKSAEESHIRANLLMQQYPKTGHFHQMNMAAINPALHSVLLRNPGNGIINPTAAAFLMQNAANIPAGMDLMGKSPMEIYANVLNQYMIANNSVMNFSPTMDLAKMAEERLRLSQMMQQSPISHSHQHSPPEVPQKSPQLSSETMTDDIHNALDLRNPKRPVNIISSEAGPIDKKKRKRKGKALRYERQNDHFQMDDNEVLDYSYNNVENSKSPKLEYAEPENSACKYCDIAFPPELYKLHMNFHSNSLDPFRCNVCGIKSSDKVSFFVHLATASH